MTCDRETYITYKADLDRPVREWRYIACCNGQPDCGFEIEYQDEDGDSVVCDEPFSMSSGEMFHMDALHRKFSPTSDAWA